MCRIRRLTGRRRTKVFLRPARSEDASAIASLVDLAYRGYVERIGRQPGPMLEDYARVIREREVTVAEENRNVVGVLVLVPMKDHYLLQNVAVHPADHGRGIGKALLKHAEAEARRRGFASIHLYTHERMTENRALYARIGYVEYDSREEDGFARVYLRKKLD